MASSKVFHFQQFSIHQEFSAMKVGTDGVLLAAWTDLSDWFSCPIKALDIGAGTGVTSLVLAQRHQLASIDAVEIEQGAFNECQGNFLRSPWADRLSIFHESFVSFIESMDRWQTYDLIISNPPFFSENFFPKNKERKMARSEQSLSFEQLLQGVERLLKPQGRFSVIIPYGQEDRFLCLAEVCELYPCRITRVRGTMTAKLKRSLIVFSKQQDKKKIQEDELVLEADQGQYTSDYKALVGGLYTGKRYR